MHLEAGSRAGFHGQDFLRLRRVQEHYEFNGLVKCENG